MIKARRTITAVCLATLMTATSFSTITPFPQTTITAEAASTVSIEQAGKKIAKAQDKAFNTKKDVTVTVKVKCSSSKKKLKKTISDIQTAIAKTELGDAYNEKANHYKPSLRSFYVGGEEVTVAFGGAATANAKVSGGVLTLKVTIPGGKKVFKDKYKDNTYLKQNVADLKKRVNGMDEKEKAWEVALWVRERSSYDYEDIDASAEAVYKKQASGVCETLADLYLEYAHLAGVEKPGKVLCHAADHSWNCVEIDGETYYLDIQGVETLNGDYNWLVENIDSTDEKAIATLKRLYSDDIFVTTYHKTGVMMSRGEYCLQATSAEIIGNSDYGKPSQWQYRWKL